MTRKQFVIRVKQAKLGLNYTNCDKKYDIKLSTNDYQDNDIDLKQCYEKYFLYNQISFVVTDLFKNYYYINTAYRTSCFDLCGYGLFFTKTFHA